MRKTIPYCLFPICLFPICLLAGCGGVGAGGLVVDVPPPGCYAVLRVVDGDTLDIGVPLADGAVLRQRVRLLRVYAPERGEELYDQAKADLTRLAGQRVRLTYPNAKRKRGYYGRLLGTLWPGDNSKIRNPKSKIAPRQSINEQMRKLGWTNYGRGGKRKKKR